MKAIETVYKGYVFRSRLEAKWATFFDLCGWRWAYEPVDFNGWIPDFALYGSTLVYVEIKPVILFPLEVARKIDNSGCDDECIILGQKPSINDTDMGVNGSPMLGWLGETGYPDDSTNWDHAVMGKWEGEVGFCHAYGSYKDRITGKYNGSCGGYGMDPIEVDRLWAMACNQTKWYPRKR